MTYREDPTGAQTIKQWQKVPEINIDLLEKKKIQRHFLKHNRASVEVDPKALLGTSNKGYRTREMFNKTNQSTNFIQMSPRLSNFASNDQSSAFFTENNKRLRKANNQQYTKNILTARRTRAMREDEKYNAQKWEYTSAYLYDKFNGKLDDPNLHNRGITGFTFSPDKMSR